eukprot:CAMPEP_0206257642 /NCGR_PEP_ID=MMETSP0047_2-20121206/25459_1 /ASSEMBLY_ACC=CAM_ASM_000192 /TAXON_ID=195065 /ORGANISM="Chroomonas mesostigmatica_cf, Strain CCMP1168" /LENGTH=369 /DNA_ID=CAMNT_0053684261 /DNA_START=33 /DNA_END=1139 /DNA_ORIENTATION=-
MAQDVHGKLSSMPPWELPAAIKYLSALAVSHSGKDYVAKDFYVPRNVIKDLSPTIEKLSPRQAVRMLYFLAKMKQHPGPNVLQQLAQRFEASMECMSGRERWSLVGAKDLSMLLHAYAQLEEPLPEALGRTLESRLIGACDQITPQGQSLIMLAFAKLQWKADDELLRELVGRCSESIDEFKLIEMCNFLIGAARLGAHLPPPRIEARALAHDDRISFRDVSSIYSTLLRLGRTPSAALAERFAKELERHTVGGAEADGFSLSHSAADVFLAAASLGAEDLERVPLGLIMSAVETVPECFSRKQALFCVWALEALVASGKAEVPASLLHTLRARAERGERREVDVRAGARGTLTGRGKAEVPASLLHMP